MRHGQSFSDQYLSVFAQKSKTAEAEARREQLPHLFNLNSNETFLHFAEAYAKTTPLHLLTLRLANTLHKAGSIHIKGHDSSIEAGYLYLAQFAIHDMISSEKIGQLSQFKPTSLHNKSTVSLDLNSLYGADLNGKTDQFFDIGEEEKGRTYFRLGYMGKTKIEKKQDGTLKKHFTPTRQEDIPRFKLGPLQGLDDKAHQYEPLLADLRNADNFIISQLTVLFKKLHNKILDKTEDFDLTRSICISVYKNILKNELLKKLCNSDVLDFYNRASSVSDLIGQNGNDTFEISLESAMAGLRFGHAMVRHRYHISDEHSGFDPASLDKLLNFMGLTREAVNNIPVKDSWVIDWSSFFHNLPQTDKISRPAKDKNHTHKIAPVIVHTLGSHESTVFKPEPPFDLPNTQLGLAFRTLAKGLVFELPTGQILYEKLKHHHTPKDAVVPPKAIEEMMQGFLEKFHDNGTPDYFYDEKDGRQILNDQDLDFVARHSPLFFYILVEAYHHHQGNHLGYVGSHLVCHAFFGALLNSEKKSDLELEHVFPEAPKNMVELITYCETEETGKGIS